MHTDLMCTPGFDLYLDEGKPAIRRLKSLKDAVVRNGFATTGPACRHTGAAHQVAADRALDCARRLGKPALNQSKVLLLNAAAGELGGQLAVSDVVLGDDDQPAGVAI